MLLQEWIPRSFSPAEGRWQASILDIEPRVISICSGATTIGWEICQTLYDSD